MEIAAQYFICDLQFVPSHPKNRNDADTFDETEVWVYRGGIKDV